MGVDYFYKRLLQYSDAVFSLAMLSLKKDSSARFPFDKLTHILRIKIVAFEMWKQRFISTE